MNTLFCLCDNCKHPIIISPVVEISLLPTAQAIHCEICFHENRDIEDLKQYAKQSRQYTGN